MRICIALTLLAFLVIPSPSATLVDEYNKGSAHIVWTSERTAFGVSVSPSGNCLAYFDTPTKPGDVHWGRIYLMNPDQTDRTKVRDEKTSVVHMQCLDDGLWYQAEDASEIVRIDLETHTQTPVLSAGTDTNLGRIGSIYHFMVDEMDPSRRFVIATIGGIAGLYLLNSDNPNVVTFVMHTDTFGFDDRATKLPSISGRRMLSLGWHSDSEIWLLQTDLETKVVTPLFGNWTKTKTGRFLETDNVRSSGNIVLYSTLKNPFTNADRGGLTHASFAPRGEILASDAFTKPSLTSIVNAPFVNNRPTGLLLEDKSIQWDITGVTLFPTNGPHSIILEDDSVLLKSGDRIDSHQVESIGLPVSSTDFIAVPLRRNISNVAEITSGILIIPKKRKPVFTRDGVVNAASFAHDLAPNAWTSLFGKNLIPGRETDEVKVLVNGYEANVSYLSDSLLNFLMPRSTPVGTALLEVVHQNEFGYVRTQASTSIKVARYAPGLFQMKNAEGKLEVIVTNNDPFYVATKERPIAQSTPVAINLWGTGFDAEAPTEVTIAGLNAQVLWIGEVMPGLMQVNVLVPTEIIGDVSGEVRIAGYTFPLMLHGGQP